MIISPILKDAAKTFTKTALFFGGGILGGLVIASVYQLINKMVSNDWLSFGIAATLMLAIYSIGSAFWFARKE